MISWIRSAFKTLLYKAYVIALLCFVVWAGKFIYPLIYWEFQHVGVVRSFELDKKDDAMTKLQKIRHHLENNVQTRSYDLGDTKFKEHYQKGHFHHVGQSLNDPVLNGCDYCHTVFPHIKNKEARAFRNMHGYFLACETCHFRTDMKNNLAHQWINSKTGEPMERPNLQKVSDKELSKAKGNYGARIAPWAKNNKGKISIVTISDLEQARFVLNSFASMSKGDVNKALVGMHKKITTKPLECDACHSNSQKVLSYADLGYSKRERRRLLDAEIVSVINKYKKFHFPGLFQGKEN